MGKQKRAKARRRDNRAAQKESVLSDEPYSLSYYAVAFVDILGYRTALRGMSYGISPLPDPGSDEEKALLTATGRAVRIRRDVLGAVDTFMSKALMTNQPVPDGAAHLVNFVQEWRKFRVGSARFGDSFVYYVSLAPGPNHVLPMRALLSMLVGCSWAMIIALSRGCNDVHETLPLRGAIDFDVGTEIPDRNGGTQLYSAALAGAYELESQEADVPRILISDSFRSMLDSHLQSVPPTATEADRANAAMARRAHSLLFQDLDGRWALDFAGKGLYDMLVASNLQPFVQRAWNYVQKAHRACCEAQNATLLPKYEWLEKYLKARLIIWGL